MTVEPNCAAWETSGRDDRGEWVNMYLGIEVRCEDVFGGFDELSGLSSGGVVRFKVFLGLVYSLFRLALRGDRVSLSHLRARTQ